MVYRDRALGTLSERVSSRSDFFECCVVLDARGQDSVKSLRDEIARYENEKEVWLNHIDDLCNGYLLGIANGCLKFRERAEHAERISLYVHDSASRCFQLLGRYSPNSRYRISKNKIYPDKEGVIAEAWEKGKCYHGKISARDTNGYKKFHAKLGLTDERIRSLGMPSRMYYGYRVNRVKDDSAVAVIIVEATDPSRFSMEDLDHLFGQLDRVLVPLVETVQRYGPELSEASKRGF